MEIELAVEMFHMTVTTDEARQNGLAFHVDFFGVIGHANFAAPADRLEPAGLDDDDGIVDRRPSGTINQLSATHYECFVRHSCLPPCYRCRRLLDTVY